MGEQQQGTATMQAPQADQPRAAQPQAAQSQHDKELETIIDRLLTNDPSSHHEIFNRLKMDWHATVEEHGDVLATKAGITAKSSIVTRTGKLMLSSGTEKISPSIRQMTAYISFSSAVRFTKSLP